MDSRIDDTDDQLALDIAVIGMSCSFPQAKGLEQFWELLRSGKEAISFFTDEELLERGVSRDRLNDPNYVKAASIMEDHDVFDAGFFGISPNEAKSMDPQHRIFLEGCWEGLEHAGYDPEKYDGDIGIFAGVGMNTYLFEVLGKNPEYLKSISQEQIMIGNDKDFLPTRVAYKLNLRGPSININTACSTSLVAIHLSRQSLLLGECDMAIAGGVSISLPFRNGYTYMSDGIQSQDGHCRAFDADAGGTIWGDGCGVVVLKRLADAIRDGDSIHAVIKGSAINNDGSNKVGYTAPSVEGQSKVIVEALAVSGLSPDQINYVEAHGTGTALGDPIEIAALSQAFRYGTDRQAFCPIGSVKTNIGHLNSAAGIAGLIKTILSLQNRQLPPSLHYKSPNPKIDFESSPFFVNSTLMDWEMESGPLRAGVSSMGIGGTNCHVIVEEAPAVSAQPATIQDVEQHTLLLSARSQEALERVTVNLADYLGNHPELSIENVAYTLQCGRRSFSHRRALRARTIEEAVFILRERESGALLDARDVQSNESFLWQDPELEAWIKGREVNWLVRWERRSPRRVPLPTYPFERTRYWVEPAAAPTEQLTAQHDDYFKKLEDMSDWYYLPSWRTSSLSFIHKPQEAKVRMIFLDKFEVGDAIASSYEKEPGTTIKVTIGKRYKQTEELSFVLNPTEPDDFRRMLTVLHESDLLPDSIIFAWGLDTASYESEPNLKTLINAQNNGFFALLQLVQAIDERLLTKKVELIALTNNAFDVLGNETLCVDASTIYGLLLVVQQAYDNFVCRLIDLSVLESEPSSKQRNQTIVAVRKEIEHPTNELVCAYRGEKRFVRKYESLKVEKDAPRYNTLRSDGIYLVFGALEGIGYLISEHMVRNIGAKVLILEESNFPEQADWNKWLLEKGDDDPISQRIQHAVSLVENGAQYIGRIGNMEEVDTLLTSVQAQVGTITGIIHAPGASNAKRVRSIASTSKDTWEEHFDNVVFSLIVMERYFHNKPLDFRIMLNSLGSVLGGDGFIQIATVSNYAKAYLTRQNRMDEQNWVVQCWDSWVIEWGQIRNYLPDAVYARLEPSVLTHEEGIDCFEHSFAVSGVVELDISATDLNNRYKKWVSLEPLQKENSKEMEKEAKHSRPDLITAYEAPSSDIERSLEAIFGELLGIEAVGIHDNFFELGGHSLLGLQLASKIRNQYHVDVNIYYIYNYPTIAGLTAYLESPEQNIVV
ncbi:beta-ketoacyl synthase N-terminal-like domain-containing protein [Paenibacillus sp. NPDC056933]|uniref:type I polyketide synthase n=1 Tax=Paenibacillus sp. NPDC056933 TaxID=3345968 RepID=UPI00364437C6